MAKVGVLVSGTGRNMVALLEAEEQGRLGDAHIACVVSSRPTAPAITKAHAFGKAAYALNHKDFDRREPFEAQILELLSRHTVDWVVLAGFMRILTRSFVDKYPDRILNIHPSLLPAFRGANAQQQALEFGVRVSGCTVHIVTNDLDAGTILGQAAVPVFSNDTVHSLSDRIMTQELQLYPRIVARVVGGVRGLGSPLVSQSLFSVG